MNILFLALDVDLSAHRGDAIHTREINASLARAGHHVRLIAGADGPGGIIPGVETTIIPASGNLAVVSHVQKAIQSFHPDVIYERRYSPKISMTVSRLSGIPFVVEINGIIEEEAAMAGRAMPDTPIQHAKSRIRRRMFGRAAAVITVTEGLRDVIVQRFGVAPERVFVAENGVDSRLFRPIDPAQSRSTWGLSSGPLVCFVGNLVAWQGVDVLIEAMAALPTQVHLMIVGDGPSKRVLLQRTEELALGNRVRFVGTIPHEKVPSCISASNVCAAPFSSERNARSGVSALKVVEYLACGRPVVVSDVPGAREIVDAYGCGLVVPPGDSSALASALAQAIDDPTLGIGALRASEFVRKELSWDHTATIVLRVLDTVVRR